MYTYHKTEPGLWTVGDYDSGKFTPESDHDTINAAVYRVHYLNGGSHNPALLSALKAMLEWAGPIAKEEACDHAVGICWCGAHQACEEAEQAIKQAGG